MRKKILFCFIAILLCFSLVVACGKKDDEDDPVVYPEQIVNGGFEEGLENLTGWTRNGNAFSTRGVVETSSITALDNSKVGTYFFSGKNAGNPQFTGSLTSDMFKLSKSGFITFKMGGGKDSSKIFIEFFEKDNAAALLKVTNTDFVDPEITDVMIRNVVDLSTHIGKILYIKITDNDDGEDYSWINADDFKVLEESEIAAYQLERTEQLAELEPEPFDENETSNKIVNGDFEKGNGDLTGWKILSGTAFTESCVVNTSTFWGGTFNKQGSRFFRGFVNDESLVGSMRSTKFTLGGDGYISFMIGGAKLKDMLYVAVCDGNTGAELIKIGNDHFEDPTMAETLNRKFIDASEYKGRVLYMKVVDNRAGSDFGAINVDDFQVSLTLDEFKALIASTKSAAASMTGTGSNAGIKSSLILIYKNTSYPIAGNAPALISKPDDIESGPRENYNLITNVLNNVVYEDDYTAESDVTKVITKIVKNGGTPITTGFMNFDLSALGEYVITVKATDAYEQSSETTVKITISNIENPEITSETFTHYVGVGTFDITSLLTKVTAISNKNTPEQLAKTIDSVDSVTSGTWTAYNFSTAGNSHVITYRVTDTENYYSTGTFTITVVGTDIINVSFEEAVGGNYLNGWTVTGGAATAITTSTTFWSGDVNWQYTQTPSGSGTYRQVYQEGLRFINTETAGGKKGTISSAKFVVGDDTFITFKMGGGNNTNLYVGIIDANTGAILKKVQNTLFSDPNMWLNMQRWYIDASAWAGKVVYVTIVDDFTDSWDAITFDDLKVNMTKAEAQTLLDADKAWALALAVPADQTPNNLTAVTALFNAQKNYYAGLSLVDVRAPVINTRIQNDVIIANNSVNLNSYLSGIVAVNGTGVSGALTNSIQKVAFNNITITTGNWAAYDMSETGNYTITYRVTGSDNRYTENTFTVTTTPAVMNQILNGGFETGDLTGWTQLSGNDITSGVTNNSDFWGEKIPFNKSGTYFLQVGVGNLEENYVYELKSTNFTLAGSGYISFKMGGNLAALKVYKANGELIAIFRNTAFADVNFPLIAGGSRLATMTTFVADLSTYLNQDLYIVLADDQTGGWGVSMFDEIITYYETAPVVAGSFDTVKESNDGGNVNINWMTPVFQPIVINAGFDSNTTGWTYTTGSDDGTKTGTLTRVETGGQSGAYASIGSFDTAAGTKTGTLTQSVSTSGGFKVGDQVVLSFAIKTNNRTSNTGAISFIVGDQKISSSGNWTNAWVIRTSAKVTLTAADIDTDGNLLIGVNFTTTSTAADRAAHLDTFNVVLYR